MWVCSMSPPRNFDSWMASLLLSAMIDLEGGREEEGKFPCYCSQVSARMQSPWRGRVNRGSQTHGSMSGATALYPEVDGVTSSDAV